MQQDEFLAVAMPLRIACVASRTQRGAWEPGGSNVCLQNIAAAEAQITVASGRSLWCHT